MTGEAHVARQRRYPLIGIDRALEPSDDDASSSPVKN
jgi:hypothetical protein